MKVRNEKQKIITIRQAFDSIHVEQLLGNNTFEISFKKKNAGIRAIVQIHESLRKHTNR